MKIKLLEAGWETYTGDLGTVPFHKGVSEQGISPREARSLGAYIKIMEIDDDGNDLGIVNPALEQVRLSGLAAPQHAQLKTQAQIDAEAAPIVAVAVEGAEVRTKPYSLEELEALASEGGIAAIREIATPLGVKATAVRTLISEILARQPQD